MLHLASAGPASNRSKQLLRLGSVHRHLAQIDGAGCPVDGDDVTFLDARVAETCGSQPVSMASSWRPTKQTFPRPSDRSSISSFHLADLGGEAFQSIAI
jgi:hypothetical protein